MSECVQHTASATFSKFTLQTHRTAPPSYRLKTHISSGFTSQHATANGPKCQAQELRHTVGCLQDVFGLFMWVFRRLENPSSPSYQLTLSVLDNISQVHDDLFSYTSHTGLQDAKEKLLVL